MHCRCTSGNTRAAAAPNNNSKRTMLIQTAGGGGGGNDSRKAHGGTPPMHTPLRSNRSRGGGLQPLDGGRHSRARSCLLPKSGGGGQGGGLDDVSGRIDTRRIFKHTRSVTGTCGGPAAGGSGFDKI